MSGSAVLSSKPLLSGRPRRRLHVGPPMTATVAAPTTWIASAAVRAGQARRAAARMAGRSWVPQRVRPALAESDSSLSMEPLALWEERRGELG